MFKAKKGGHNVHIQINKHNSILNKLSFNKVSLKINRDSFFTERLQSRTLVANINKSNYRRVRRAQPDYLPV